MKRKLEAIANVTVILVALAVGGVVLTRYAQSYRAPRSVAAGDHLAKLPGLDWRRVADIFDASIKRVGWRTFTHNVLDR